LLVNEAIFKGCKKVAQMKELLLCFEEYFVAYSLLNRPMLQKFRLENFRLLSLLLPGLEDLKYQLHEAIVLSILYISTDNAGISRRDFLKAIEKVVKKKCTKLSTIRKSKSYLQLTNLMVRFSFKSDHELGVPRVVC
jgi:hypothetical protein